MLGVLAMIDSGETDWKLIAINVADPMAHLLNDLADIETHMRAASSNEFAFDGKAQGRAYSEALIEETHEDWEALIEERGKAAIHVKGE